MALWGNNDAVGSGGTVSLNYSTRVVTGFNGVGGAAGEAGSGTTFGQTGFAQVGNIISFGQHGSGTYYGDAVIASIAGTTSLTIASTCGLIGGGITGVAYQVSQKPSYVPADSHYSAAAEAPTANTIDTGVADATSGIGSDSVAITLSDIPDVQIGDYLVNNSDNFAIIAVGLCTALATATVSPGDFVLRAILPDFLVSGETTVGLGTTQPTIAGAGETVANTSGAVSAGATIIPLTNGNKFNLLAGDVVKIPGGSDGSIHTVGTNQVSLAATVPAIASGAAITFTSDTIAIIDTPSAADLTIAIGDTITFQGDNGTPGNVLSLDEGIGAAITLGDTLTFKRVTDGYDAYVYGVNQSGIATGTQFETGVGWVGVTTYMDNSGSLRVKKEILVAMSGITTGNPDSYPPA
jgi:hypothetical protein